MDRTQEEWGFTGFQVPFTPTDKHSGIFQVVSGLHTPSVDLMMNIFLGCNHLVIVTVGPRHPVVLLGGTTTWGCYEGHDSWYKAVKPEKVNNWKHLRLP